MPHIARPPWLWSWPGHSVVTLPWSSQLSLFFASPGAKTLRGGFLHDCYSTASSSCLFVWDTALLMMAGRLGHLGFCRRPKTRSLENGAWRVLGLEGRDGGAPGPSKQPLHLNIAGHRLVSGVGLPFLYRSFWTKEAGSVPGSGTEHVTH